MVRILLADDELDLRADGDRSLDRTDLVRLVEVSDIPAELTLFTAAACCEQDDETERGLHRNGVKRRSRPTWKLPMASAASAWRPSLSVQSLLSWKPGAESFAQPAIGARIVYSNDGPIDTARVRR